MFINDRAWNLRKAKENYDNMAWHMKRAAEAAKRNDSRSAKDHTDSAKMFKAKGDEYMDAAKRSTK